MFKLRCPIAVDVRISVLFGDAGDDNYFVEDALDTITEIAGNGTDTVNASASFTISSEIERLTLTGADAIDGTGNSGANLITGNTAVNTLSGAGGDDTITGGGGADILVGGTGNDTYIADSDDTILEVAGEGTDTAESATNYTLASEVENLVLTGGAAINGTGNASANTITGQQRGQHARWRRWR